ncbi:hypothetical protein BH09VER1_BH09VER1_42120 [soil metagenome]
MSKPNRCLVALGVACLFGLLDLRANTLPENNLSLRHGLDTSLPPAKSPIITVSEDDLVKPVGAVTTFEEIIPLALADGHVAYIKITTDPPPGFRREMLFLSGSGGFTSTMRGIQTVRFLARKNYPPAFPPWTELWAYIRTTIRP